MGKVTLRSDSDGDENRDVYVSLADDGIKNKEQALAYVRSISEALGKLPMKVLCGLYLHRHSY